MEGKAALLELVKGKSVAEHSTYAAQNCIQDQALVGNQQAGKHDSDGELVFIPPDYVSLAAAGIQNRNDAQEPLSAFLGIAMFTDGHEHQEERFFRPLCSFSLDSNGSF